MTYSENYKLFSGQGSKNILFLPGWMTTGDNYTSLIDKLKSFGQVLFVELPGFSGSLDNPLYVDDYLQSVRNVLKETAFVPDLAIGYSFGGKLLMLLEPELQTADLFLIAPSCFRPSLKSRIRVKVKIGAYKLFKNLKKHYLIEKIPTCLSGSSDYRQSEGNIRQTLLNVKDIYVLNSALRDFNSNIFVLGYRDDTSVSIKVLRRNCRRIKHAELFESGGTHYELFSDDNLIETIIERIFGR